MRSSQLACVPTLLAFTLTAALAAPLVARAQELSVGARVRVSAPEFNIENRTGTITRLTADSLSVDFGWRPPLTTAIDRLARLEVSVGKNRGAGFVHGVGVGAGVGAVVGFGLGALALRGGCTTDAGPPCELLYVVTIAGGRPLA